MNMGQNTKGNDGKGARKKLLRQIGWLCAIIVGWVVLFKVLYWSLGGSSPSIPSSRHRHHEDDRIDGSGTGRGGIKSEGAFFGGSNWRANPGNVGGALKDVTRGLRNGLSQFSNAAKEEAAEFRRNLHLQFRADGQRDEDDVLQDIIDAKLHLVDLKIIDEELEAAPRNSYAGIYGSFCKLNWEMHKRDPSAGTSSVLFSYIVVFSVCCLLTSLVCCFDVCLLFRSEFIFFAVSDSLFFCF